MDVARQKACTLIVIGRQLVMEQPQATHLRVTQTTELLRPRYYISQLESCQGHYFRVCHLCTGKPQRRGEMFWVGSRPRNTTGEDWVLDLTVIEPTAT